MQRMDRLGGDQGNLSFKRESVLTSRQPSAPESARPVRDLLEVHALLANNGRNIVGLYLVMALLPAHTSFAHASARRL